MHRIALAAVALLAGCSEAGKENDAAQDARDIAMVNAAQDAKPPARPIAPEPILFFDITKNRLYGSGCNFVPEGGGMGAVLLAQPDRAIMKLNGNIVTLASDPGSAQLPQGSWSRYTGKAFALVLTEDSGTPRTRNGVVETFRGELVVTDPHDQVIYRAPGTAQCKPM